MHLNDSCLNCVRLERMLKRGMRRELSINENKLIWLRIRLINRWN